MTLKKLLLIGSISAVVVAAAVVIPIVVIKSNKKANESQNKQPTQDDVIDDDKLGPEMQTQLDNSYITYYSAAESDVSISKKQKEKVYLSKTKGLNNTSDSKKVYYWNMNDGVWDLYSSSATSITPVVNPEQAFGGYYVYY